MINRTLQKRLIELNKYFPVTTVTGPRQSGKTTLIRNTFKEYPYVSLEDPDNNMFAKEDPRGFLDNYTKGVIIDEAQKQPELFSYIQGIVDTDKKRKFIVSGSQNFLLSQHISQSLAGRVGILTLLPFSMTELKSAKMLKASFEKIATTGFYPRIYDQNIPPIDFYANYVQTYVERDVRQITQVTNLNSFSTFLKLCAGRVGQLLNLSELANSTGVSVNTIKSWISILEASYIVFRLQPHHKNYSKRLVKMPKLYFYDTGLLCYLLSIKSDIELKTHYAKGAIFENFIILELLKSRSHQGYQPNFYFWRNHKGQEIDLIIENGNHLIPVEIKSGSTKKGDYFKEIDYWNKISGNSPDRSFVVYGGKEDQTRSNGILMAWKSIIDFDFTE